MSEINTGGPAFPPSNPGYAHGMTLRDYFAAKAMQAIIATERASEFVDDEGYEMDYSEEGSTGTLFIHTNFLAEEAYSIADNMLAARERGGKA